MARWASCYLACVDLSAFTREELRAIATRNLAECCDDCRVILRKQLADEEDWLEVDDGD